MRTLARKLRTGRVIAAIALVVAASVLAALAVETLDHVGSATGGPAGTGTHPNGTGRPPFGPPPVADPANCTQGTHSIHLAAGSGNQRTAIMTAYSTLGSEGGGTIYLGPGTFTIDQTLNFLQYGNISIQGAGMGATTLALPSDPVGNFLAENGSALGQYDPVTGGPVNGTSANFIEVSGPGPVDNFQLCNLALNAEANNASEAWAGSLVYDMSGGSHHVYSDVAEDGLFGPSTTPNGIHLEPGASSLHIPALGYVIDGLYASDNSLPFENYSDYKGGPNFLNVGPIVNCTMDEVNGIGLVAFEVAPPHGCTSENWAISGHMLIDPGTGGSWGGSVFENITVNTNGTASPNALGISVNNGSGGESSNFTNMRWNFDAFIGTVLGGPNMISVDNSTFWGGIAPTPSQFDGNLVYWADQSVNRLSLPIPTDGTPTGGVSSLLDGNTFIFPNGTNNRDPFLLTVPHNTWADDLVEISGSSSDFLMGGAGVSLSESSSFSQLTYESLGNNSPVDLLLVDVLGSPGFVDLGASVWSLHGVFDDLPVLTPSPPSDVRLLAESPVELSVTWDAAFGPVTNYTVFSGPSMAKLAPAASVGNVTAYTLTGLSPAESVFVSVEAWNGTRPSALASAAFDTTPDWTPDIPTGLTDSGSGPSSVSLNWTAPAAGNVSNYTLLIAGGPAHVDENLSVGVVEHCTVPGLSSATEYAFEVEAWNGSWTKGPSAPIFVNTSAASSPPPSGTAPPGASTPGSMGSHPLSLSDWVGIVEVFGVVLGGVVGPVALLSRLRSAHAAR
jgi:hypothetical protein